MIFLKKILDKILYKDKALFDTCGRKARNFRIQANRASNLNKKRMLEYKASCMILAASKIKR
jgi:hypothetical protein